MEDGVYSCEEWLGTGEKITYQFELGKEFKMVSSERGHFSTCVVTQDISSSYLMVAKDKLSGVVSEFKFNVNDNGLSGVWSVPSKKESSSLEYRRVGDCQGKWVLAVKTDMEPLHSHLGLNEDEKKVMEGMFKTYEMAQIGANQWGFKGDIDITTPIKFGEEFSYEMIGRQCTELCTQTKEGYVSVFKMGKNIVVTNMKFGKHFQVGEMIADGNEDTKATVIYTRA